jgi:hypothetical protein
LACFFDLQQILAMAREEDFDRLENLAFSQMGVLRIIPPTF